MMRRIAVAGDKLSNGGEVCYQNGPIFTFGDAGHQAALINGAAYCPICRTTGYIAKDGGPRRMTIVGSEIALDRDLIVCGCPENPRIFAQLAGEAWYDDLAESLGVIDTKKNAQRVAQTVFRPGERSENCASWFYVTDSATGRPLCNQQLIAVVAGIEQACKTDANGYAKVETNDPQSIDIHVFFSSPKRNLIPAQGD
ncbi:PAAR domain-containing protein [Caballeronia sp. ATUFL_M2_KS44]|uniref:PAAR domain-containing protein n=1 Tax=Caballeronia sp. ATUFL_M2_KS44 TaxID=2921767 RepID=UPI0020283AD6|nr:PAAR domain-containing protein [Caballeronia sp. ATUFL_M2_KS44]